MLEWRFAPVGSADSSHSGGGGGGSNSAAAHGALVSRKVKPAGCIFLEDIAGT